MAVLHRVFCTLNCYISVFFILYFFFYFQTFYLLTLIQSIFFYCIFPLEGSRDILLNFPFASVCLSVRTHKWTLVGYFYFPKFTGICWVLTLFWLLFLTLLVPNKNPNVRASVKTIWVKLHTLLEHNETMCRAQEALLCFGYFSSNLASMFIYARQIL